MCSSFRMSSVGIDTGADHLPLSSHRLICVSSPTVAAAGGATGWSYDEVLPYLMKTRR